MSDGILDTSNYVRVTNKTGIKFVGMYDGQEYVFSVGVPIDIHINSAKHIFGFGEKDKRACFLRWGWMDGNRSYDDAMNYLNAFTFEEVQAPIVNISSAKSRNKISKPTPLVNAGVEAGEGNTSPTEASEAVGDL